MKSLRFNRKDNPEFIKVLRQRVNTYFSENNISRHADSRMVFKTIFMLCLYLVPFILMLSQTVTGFWPVLALWAVMGFGMSGIGLSVMHDANHGAYSANQNINKFCGGLITIIGGYSANWKIQHNLLHHSYTNVDGFDEDLDSGLLRFSPNQDHKPYHKYQIFYGPLLYGLMTIYWCFSKDIVAYRRYKQEKLYVTQKLSEKQVVLRIVTNKVIYFSLFLILPLIIVNLPWWQICIGFFLMHYISGLLLAFIFQSAHIIEETEFIEPSDAGALENSWAIHQLRTTANFAKKNRILSWFIGGLNFQIEHHLFPNICHIHYRKLSEIVSSTAKEYDLPYYEHGTFRSAVKSHLILLRDLGRGLTGKLHTS